MNKIKWEQCPDYKLPIHLVIPSNLSYAECKVFMFLFQNETFFLFINQSLLVLNLTIPHNNNHTNTPSFIFDSKHECNYLSPMEFLCDIIQSQSHRNEFIFASSKGKLYRILFSAIDYYSEMKGMISLKENTYKIFQYIHSTIILLIGESLYSYDHSNSNNTNSIGNCKRLLYQPNLTIKEKILKATINHIKHIVLVFTNIDIKMIHLEKNYTQVTIMYKYESSPQSYIGMSYINKIYYMKGNDELGIYDINDEKNNSSMTFSTKKMFNKISFNKVIYVNEELIAIVNESKGELYVYSFKYNTFNRESTLYDNKSYLLNQNNLCIYALGFNPRTMILKGKIGSFDMTNKSSILTSVCNNGISLTEDKIDDLFCEIELGDLEKEYEDRNNIELYKQKAIRKNQRIIKTFISQMNSLNYEKNKEEIKKTIVIMRTLETCENTMKEYEIKVYGCMEICFIRLYGSYCLIVNWRKVMLQYIINEMIISTDKMINLSRDNYDIDSFIKLIQYKKKVKQLMI